MMYLLSVTHAGILILQMAREFGDVLAETLRCAADCASRSQKESKDLALLSPLNHLTKEVSDIVLASVARDGTVVAYAVTPFESGEHIVLSAVRQNGFALRYADEVLHRNRQVVIEAVNNTAPVSKTPKTVLAQTATWLDGLGDRPRGRKTELHCSLYSPMVTQAAKQSASSMPGRCRRWLYIH